MSSTPQAKPATPVVKEIRYSLPQLLQEVQLEREASAFAMERLDQSDINRLFGKKRVRRAVTPGK